MYHLCPRTPMTLLLMIIISEQNRLTDDINSSIMNYKRQFRGLVTRLTDRVELFLRDYEWFQSIPTNHFVLSLHPGGETVFYFHVMKRKIVTETNFKMCTRGWIIFPDCAIVFNTFGVVVIWSDDVINFPITNNRTKLYGAQNLYFKESITFFFVTHPRIVVLDPQ